MLDAPWWLHEPPASMPLPWSGEVIPIEEAPPIPPSVPIAGPVIQFIGEGEHAVWNDVWNWAKSTARTTASDVVNLIEKEAAEAVKVAEAYTGAVLQALSGFINDAFDFTDWVAGDAFSLITGLGTAIGDDVRGIDVILYDVLGAINGIEGDIIPHIEAELAELGTATGAFIRAGVAQVEGWAIDTIYDPLLSEIWGVGVQAEVDIQDGLAHVLDEAKAYADAHAAAIAATIAAAAAAAAAATSWIDDCGEPMCETIGPKTDLGKLLKGLALAADAAALADLLSLTEDELVARITDTIREFSGFISTIERDFITGGRTLGATIAGL